MKDLEAWLDEMATRPLPGAVAAAATAAALGAALLGKVARLAVQQQSLHGGDDLQGVIDLARTQQRELLRLADADVQAFQAVLDTQALAATDPARRQAWRLATEVPVQVAEACERAEHGLTRLKDRCPVCVRAELETSGWLLQTGKRSGILTAEANLGLWGECEEAGALRLRLDALRENRT